MQDLLARARERAPPRADRAARAGDLGAETVIDSTRAILVWEPRRVVPSYAVPAEDIRAALAPAPATNGDVAGVLHPGIPFGVHTAAGEPVSIGDRVGAGFRLADEDLAGYVVLDFDAFDDWFEEDEPIVGHPRDPFHRVDVRRTSRPVRIEVDGDVVAETTRARLLFETSLPLRFYLPREDVRVRLPRAPRAPTARTRATRPTGRSTPAVAGTRTWAGATSSRCRTPSRSPASSRSGTSASTCSSTASGASGRAAPIVRGAARRVRRLAGRTNSVITSGRLSRTRIGVLPRREPAHRKDCPMLERVDASTLDRQPRQRRTVYEYLAQDAEGRSVKELVRDSSVPEADLRETLRKLEAAGLVHRSKAVWIAVPIETR